MPTNPPAVRIFIGSGEASLLERKTLIHSLRQVCSRPLDIFVLNGTHDAVERNDEPPVRVNLPLSIKYRNFTEFSNYRWLIPSLCGYEGRAIYLDSDMICLADPAELFDTPMDGAQFLARPEAYQGDGRWALSVMLIDCATCRFDVERYFSEIEQGQYANGDLHEMTPTFLKHHPFRIGELDPQWNMFDRHDPQTKLIHYTNLMTQPWKFPGHEYGELWFETFAAARQAGSITDADISKTITRAYCRPDILTATASPAAAPAAIETGLMPRIRRRLKATMARAHG